MYLQRQALCDFKLQPRSGIFSNAMDGLFDLPRLPLIEAPTPLHELPRLWPDQNADVGVFVKREDLTSTRTYGGNKVRNLEFILADAVCQGATKLITVAPLGSNFVAALAAHASRANLPVEVHHFVPHMNAQIEQHALFSARQGAELIVHARGLPKELGALYASLRSLPARWTKGGYFIAPGGSDVLGAMGHARAFLETTRQFRVRNLEFPDWIVTGAGTCGTLAGLLAGAALSQTAVKIVGVRCVDPVYCNRMRVFQLANRLLRRLRSPARVAWSAIHLVDPPGLEPGYAKTHPEMESVQRAFAMHDLHLDSTYTSKVALYLRTLLTAKNVPPSRVLYWHTYSHAALCANNDL